MWQVTRLVVMGLLFVHNDIKQFEGKIMAMGRPTDYKPEYCEAVIKHMKEGGSLTSFAASVMCSRSTINLWIDANPKFMESVKIGKALCAEWWEKQGRLGATGQADVNPTLVIFGLKNMAAQDWREKQDVNHTSSDGSMSPDGLTSEQRTNRIQALLNANKSTDS